jgi:hypothetical protein
MVTLLTLLEHSEARDVSAKQLAEHHSTPASTLSQLAKCCDVAVRMAVADNRNTSVDTLMRLTADTNADLRYGVAENHNIHQSVLLALLEDTNPYVAQRAGKTLARLAVNSASSRPKLILLVDGHRFKLPENQLNCPRTLV